MREFLLSKVSLLKLFRYLRDDVTTFIRQELALARREMSEKISCYGRHIAIIAAGGLVAYAGLIVLFGSLGWLLGFGLEKLGFDPVLSVFIGCAIMAVLTISIGAIAALQGLKAMSNSTLIPEKTVETVKGLKWEEPTNGEAGVSKPSPAVLHQKTLATEDRISDEWKEITFRASAAGIKRQVTRHIKAHPFAWTGGALAGVAAGGFLVLRKFRKA